MFFDRFCSYAEKSGDRRLAKIAADAHLFVFDDAPHKFLPQEFTGDQRAELMEQFFIPFPVVAVEDAASCVILIDSEDKQQGWNNRRKFIEIRSLGTHPDAYRDIADEARQVVLEAAGDPEINQTSAIIFGNVINLLATPESDKELWINGSVQRLVMVDKHHQCKDVSYGMEETASAIRSAKTAIEEMLYANTPSRFILEKSPVKSRKVPVGRILRSHDRAKYTLLDPSKIREQMKLPSLESLGIKVIPHHIRRHYRTLRAECFKAMRGHRILVSQGWVGPSENVVGKQRYKVLLDR
jgi:hypothetical protein